MRTKSEHAHGAYRLSLTAMLLALAALLAGCGGDDGESEAGGNGTDRAFARAMIPHHEGAVDMAELAERRGEHGELKRVANEIIASQRREIATLRRVDRQLAGAGVKSGRLAVPERLRGMDHDTGFLEQAAQFDREFISMMVPHHEGAIRMSRAELRSGEDPRLRRLAREIIAAQEREIRQMRRWSKRWYGSETRADHAGH